MGRSEPVVEPGRERRVLVVVVPLVARVDEGRQAAGAVEVQLTAHFAEGALEAVLAHDGQAGVGQRRAVVALPFIPGPRVERGLQGDVGVGHLGGQTQADAAAEALDVVEAHRAAGDGHVVELG